MKFNFKKIASVLTSTVMLSSTVALAAAANYPAPFVQSGNANVAVVYGANAAITDVAAVVDITANLQAKLAEQTATSGSSSGGSVSGDAFALFTSGSKIYVNSSMNRVTSIITDSELDTVLADQEFSGNVDADVTQTINLYSTPRVTFDDQPTSDSDPTLGIALSTASNTYNSTIVFSPRVNFTHEDSEGQDITLFGQKFTIGADTDDDELVLFKSSETITLSNSALSQKITIDGKEYTVELVSASDSSATIKVSDGTSSDTKEVDEADSKKILGLEVAVNYADESEATNSVSAEVSVGSDRVVLQNGNEVTVGSDNDPIEGTTVSFVDTASTQNISEIRISVAAQDSDEDAILVGESFVDPVFGAFKIDFTGVNIPVDSTDRDMIKFSAAGNDKMQIELTERRGDTKAIEFINNASGPQILATDDREVRIRVAENAIANISQYIMVGNEDEGRLVEVKTITNSSSGFDNDNVVFRDVFTGEDYSATINAEGSGTVNIAGKSYSFIYVGASTGGDSRYIRLNYPDSTGQQVILFPTIETRKGAKVALYEPQNITLDDWNGQGGDASAILLPDGDGYTTLSLTLNGAGNYTLDSSLIGPETTSVTKTVGKLTYNFTYHGINKTQVFLQGVGGGNIANPAVVIFEEEDDNNNYEAIIARFEGGGNSDAKMGVNDIETTWGADAVFDEQQRETDSDIYDSMDFFGTFITTDRSDTDSYTATIAYPDEQVFAQVYIAEADASITPDVVSGGSVKPLGSVSVTDAEAGSVSSRNLIVVGGSCINSVAASLLGGAFCGADFTSKTGVGAGSFLIQTFSRSGGNVATLVAGYNAPDTTNAAKYLINNVVDTTVGKKYTGTSATSATLVTS